MSYFFAKLLCILCAGEHDGPVDSRIIVEVGVVVGLHLCQVDILIGIAFTHILPPMPDLHTTAGVKTNNIFNMARHYLLHAICLSLTHKHAHVNEHTHTHTFTNTHTHV